MNSLVLLAAGSGSRLNLGYNKMLFEVNGKTILEITLKKFIDSKLFDEIIIVVKQEELALWQSKNINNVQFVIGGETRQISVFNGVNVATNEFVWVHDGARCNITHDLITRLNNNVDLPGSVAAVKSKDSLRIIKDGKVDSILDRDFVYLMQTPQIVNKNIYIKCYNNALQEKVEETDEVGLLFRYGYKMNIVDGEYSNIKVTTIEDLGAIDECI